MSAKANRPEREKLKKNIGRLHVLTDTALQSRFSHVELAKLAIEGGADTIQLRQKSGSTKEMISSAGKLKDICVEAGVAFIVNDRVDVAIASRADGVHLGQDDFPIPLARKLMGEQIIIGGSAVTLEDAKKCLEEGADYVGFGPVYPTSSKLDASAPTGIELMKKAINAVPLPFIAIGGIQTQNVAEVMQAGAYGIAVISSVCCQDDPRQATQMLSQALRKGE
jgi:thiamine-phosphate pyrophosphorylase